MQNIELIVYLLVFAISIIWTSFAVNRKSATFSILSTFTWFILAVMNIALTYSTMFYSVSFLFFGFGVFFLVYGIALLIQSLNIGKGEKNWELV